MSILSPGLDRISPYVGPLAYAGQDRDRRSHLGRSFTTDGYGHDRGAPGRYRFNSLGFRCPEFDPAAESYVFVFGESHAFGYFVEASEAWPQRFANLWAEHHAIQPGALCLQNFAEVGAANTTIARAVVTQCSVVRPDLVLVHFSDFQRTQTYIEGQPYRVGPWLVQGGVELATTAPGQRELAAEQIRRAQHYYRFAVGTENPEDERDFDPRFEATLLEETLRSILLVQLFCASRGITAVATCDRSDALLGNAVRSHPTLAPLAAAVDPSFLGSPRIWSVDGDAAADEGHAGPERHDRFARAMFEWYERTQPAREPSSSKTPSPPLPDSSVRGFYQAVPRDHWSLEATVRTVQSADALSSLPDLERLVAEGQVHTVQDVGCGNGWLLATLALRLEHLTLSGLDFSSTMLTQARSLLDHLGLTDRVALQEADLTDPAVPTTADLVVCLGVLHHTPYPSLSFARLSRRVPEGGYLYLGLYHEPGRRFFRDRFQRLLATHGRDAAFDAFRRLAGPQQASEAQLRYWFREQVLHPLESQHTLMEVDGWLQQTGFSLVSTSMNRFAAFEKSEDLYYLDEPNAARGRDALAEGRYLPGFFTVLARRTAEPRGGSTA